MVVYKAEFPNGKVYIGKTKNLKLRIYHHIRNSKKCENNSIIMYRAIRKYGEINIKWEVLCECETIEEMSMMEIEYIKKYKSISHEFGYNMVCGDKEVFSKRENFDKDYQLDIIKRKLKSNGHDPDNYLVIDIEISKNIKIDYNDNKLSIRELSRKFKISRQRLSRFLKSENIEIDKNRAVLTNSVILSDQQIDFIISKYKNGKTISAISKEESETIQTISRVLHDSGTRISKRFKNGKRYDGRQPKSRQFNN